MGRSMGILYQTQIVSVMDLGACRKLQAVVR